MSLKRVLYHCMNRPPEGDELKVTCLREVNGREDSFLFAASHIAKALAFAFSYHAGEVICNGGIEGTEDEFVLLCNRAGTLAQPRHIRVYSFSADGFEKAWDDKSRQYVSTRPVKFSDTQLVLETHDINDLMRRGLQIFATEKSWEQLQAENFNQHGTESSNKNMLASLAADHGFVWENRERGINPNREISRLLERKMPGARPSP